MTTTREGGPRIPQHEMETLVDEAESSKHIGRTYEPDGPGLYTVACSCGWRGSTRYAEFVDDAMAVQISEWEEHAEPG